MTAIEIILEIKEEITKIKERLTEIETFFHNFPKIDADGHYFIENLKGQTNKLLNLLEQSSQKSSTKDKARSSIINTIIVLSFTIGLNMAIEFLKFWLSKK